MLCAVPTSTETRRRLQAKQAFKLSTCQLIHVATRSPLIQASLTRASCVTTSSNHRHNAERHNLPFKHPAPSPLESNHASFITTQRARSPTFNFNFKRQPNFYLSFPVRRITFELTGRRSTENIIRVLRMQSPLNPLRFNDLFGGVSTKWQRQSAINCPSHPSRRD